MTTNALLRNVEKDSEITTLLRDLLGKKSKMEGKTCQELNYFLEE